MCVQTQAVDFRTAAAACVRDCRPIVNISSARSLPSSGTSMKRPLRTAVLASGHAPQAQSLDALMVATSDYDVIFVESIAHSYSRIKEVLPDLVIISSEVDDVATCQLLSMLRVDRRSSGIPVLTCATFGEQSDLDDDSSEPGDRSTQSLAVPMN
jgi:PleD family two-component response regulator